MLAKNSCRLTPKSRATNLRRRPRTRMSRCREARRRRRRLPRLPPPSRRTRYSTLCGGSPPNQSSQFRRPRPLPGRPSLDPRYRRMRERTRSLLKQVSSLRRSSSLLRNVKIPASRVKNLLPCVKNPPFLDFNPRTSSTLMR